MEINSAVSTTDTFTKGNEKKKKHYFANALKMLENVTF